MNDKASIHFARNHLSQLLARVEAGEVITIARNKTPVAKLVPVAPKAKREFGAMRGQVSIGPEFFEPLPDDELDRLGSIEGAAAAGYACTDLVVGRRYFAL